MDNYFQPYAREPVSVTMKQHRFLVIQMLCLYPYYLHSQKHKNNQSKTILSLIVVVENNVNIYFVNKFIIEEYYYTLV